MENAYNKTMAKEITKGKQILDVINLPRALTASTREPALLLLF